MIKANQNLKEILAEESKKTLERSKVSSIILPEYYSNLMYIELLRNAHDAGATKANLHIGSSSIIFTDNRSSIKDLDVSKNLFGVKYEKGAVTDLVIKNALVFNIAESATITTESKEGTRTKIELNEKGDIRVKSEEPTGTHGMKIKVHTPPMYLSDFEFRDLLYYGYYLNDLAFSCGWDLSDENAHYIKPQDPAKDAVMEREFTCNYRTHKIYLNPKSDEVVIAEAGVKIASFKSALGATIIFPQELHDSEKYEQYGILTSPDWSNSQVHHMYQEWLAMLSSSKRG